MWVSWSCGVERERLGIYLGGQRRSFTRVAATRRPTLSGLDRMILLFFQPLGFVDDPIDGGRRGRVTSPETVLFTPGSVPGEVSVIALVVEPVAIEKS